MAGLTIAATVVCGLMLVHVAMPPAPAAPLWTHRVTINLDAAWYGASESWSPKAELAAVTDFASDEPDTDEPDTALTAALDAMESRLHVGLSALLIVACAVLDVDDCDAGFFTLNTELAHA